MGIIRKKQGLRVMRFIILTILLLAPKTLIAETIRCQKKISEVQKSSFSSILFFSSWCYSCLIKIKDSNPKNTLFVAVYDDFDRAQQALTYALGEKNQKTVCLWDEDHTMGREHGVISLPHDS